MSNFAYTSVYMHENMVAYYAEIISKTIHLDPVKIVVACKLHDHGKLFWHKALFTKTHNQLTPSDFKIIVQHPYNSVNVTIDKLPERKYEFSKGDPSVFDIILYHHEKPNGDGYYKVANMPIEAVVIAISDIFDACLSDRLYRKGVSLNESLSCAFYDYSDYLIKLGYDIERIRKNLAKSAIAINLEKPAK